MKSSPSAKKVGSWKLQKSTTTKSNSSNTTPTDATSLLLVSTDQQVSSALKASFPDASKLDLAVAASLAEAMTLVRRNAPQVLLFDIEGRPAGWFSPLYRLCLLRPRLPVVVLSDGGRRNLFAALLAGAAGYLIKSEILEGDLGATILRAKTGEPVLSPGAITLLVDTLHSLRRVQVERVAFTTRELQIAGFLLSGLSSKEIAGHLNCSTRTVSFHLRNLYLKLGVRNRKDATVRLVEFFGDSV